MFAEERQDRLPSTEVIDWFGEVIDCFGEPFDHFGEEFDGFGEAFDRFGRLVGGMAGAFHCARGLPAVVRAVAVLRLAQFAEADAEALGVFW